MSKIALSILAGAAMFGGQALAADMFTKWPAASVPVSNWTGLYVGLGIGYGMYNVESNQVAAAAGAVTLPQGTSGGRGWLGTALAGFDYQLAPSWVAGLFADFDLMRIGSDHLGPPVTTGIGNLENRRAWAAGGRIGYLVTPQVLTYVNVGYSAARFDQVNYLNTSTLAPNGTSLPGQTYNGWFLGGGLEYQIPWFRGLSSRTEYRVADYGRQTVTNVATVTGTPLVTAEALRPYVQTVRTQLIYKFNWSR
jgi:outer membrane immunogenic protein